jgi:hypothetical protein
MDPASLVPVADAMPVHWFWLQIPLTITTFLHLIVMNIMLGSAVIVLVAALQQDKSMLPMCRDIGRTIPFTTAFTINLGVAPLLFLQVLYGQFFYTSSILMAVYWLSIVAMLIIAYYAAYLYNTFHDRNYAFLFIAGNILLLLVIAFFFSNNVSIMQLPESWSHYFEDRNGWFLNLGDSALLVRYLHFLASAVAMGGLAIALYYQLKQCRGGEDAGRWIRMGCNWFTVATIINFGIGFRFLGALPLSVYDGSTLTGKIFIVTLIGSVFASIKSVIDAQVGRVFSACGWAALTVLLMTVARDAARIGYLKPYFSLAGLPVTPQYLPFIFFLLFFAGAVYLICWMVKQICCAKEVE